MKIPAAWREAVYAVALGMALVLSILVMLGYTTLDQINGVVVGLFAILTIFSPLLALFHITPDEPTPPTEG